MLSADSKQIGRLRQQYERNWREGEDKKWSRNDIVANVRSAPSTQQQCWNLFVANQTTFMSLCFSMIARASYNDHARAIPPTNCTYVHTQITLELSALILTAERCQNLTGKKSQKLVAFNSDIIARLVYKTKSFI